MQLKRKLGPVALLVIIIMYYFVLFPLRLAFENNQRDSDWWKDYFSNPDTPYVKVTRIGALIYIAPGKLFIGKSNKANYFTMLNEGVYFDSLKMELKKQNGSLRKQFLYISTRHKHWFYFDPHTNANTYTHGYIKPKDIDSQYFGRLAYIRWLKYHLNAVKN